MSILKRIAKLIFCENKIVAASWVISYAGFALAGVLLFCEQYCGGAAAYGISRLLCWSLGGVGYSKAGYDHFRKS